MALRIGEGQFIDGEWKTQMIANKIDDAIIHAANNGARVINMSFGAPVSSSINSAINYAYKTKNCILVAATGNETDGPIAYPANHSLVIAVSGILMNGNRYGRNSGGDVDLVAPAQNIYTTLFTDDGNSNNNDRCGNMSGTSFSAPQVCGVAALLLSHTPSLLNLDVRNIINQTADGSVGSSQYFGNGLLNASYALQSVSEDSDLPDAPSNVSILALTNPRISWSSVSGADNYKIYRAITLNERYYFTHIATVTGSTTFWVDNSITVGGGDPVYYRVSTVNSSFESILSSEVTCNSNMASKQAVKNDTEKLNEFHLFDNFPNPFNPSTKISFTIPSASFVNLEVFNIMGERISTLVNKSLEAGQHAFNFRAVNSLSSGIYIYQLQVNGEFISQKKMILLK